MKPQTIIDALRAIAPCPIVHSTRELPEHDPSYGRARRSSYFPVRSGKFAREQDYIVMNEGEARSWLYVNVLAHEVGHALDAHGLHPAQDALPRSRSGRYRAELAAVAYEIAVCRQIGLSRKKRGKRWLAESRDYLHRYKQGNNPGLETILRAIPSPVLEIPETQPQPIAVSVPQPSPVGQMQLVLF